MVCRSDGTLVAQYLLGDGEHMIGREINCPVYLDSEYISNNHAKLLLSHDGIKIEDLNSASGTFLDGVTVRGKLRIKPGQLLQVGDLTIHLQPESEGQVGPGSRLGAGRYTLIRMLGRGGMGEVWFAKDEQLDEEVALKKLPPEVGADPMALADMRREVQKSRALSHPNIIRIHDLIQQSGEDPLISLEYVDGTDLTAIAATKTGGIFGWAEIKDWMVQLANALEYAHEEKIVHRDLKPGNIMISRKGRLKLADFGIAATLADATRRSSMEGIISGTTLYMSPQQMEGKAPSVTDDVYAYGATIYELLTSHPPFYTGNVEHQVLQVTPTSPSQRMLEFGYVTIIPSYVNELVMACLAKAPEGRPQSMGAILDWIQSEGKAEGAIPKPSTKTIKMQAPAAAGDQLERQGVRAAENASKQFITKVAVLVAAGILIICFIFGLKLKDAKLALAEQKMAKDTAVTDAQTAKSKVEQKWKTAAADASTKAAQIALLDRQLRRLQGTYAQTQRQIDQANLSAQIAQAAAAKANSDLQQAQQMANQVPALQAQITAYENLGTFENIKTMLHRLAKLEAATAPATNNNVPKKTKPGLGLVGTILRHDPTLDIYVINAGSDNGIKKGDKFTIFRGARVIGKIEISRTQPTISIAVYQKGFPKPPAPFKAGDKVFLIP